MPDFEERNDAEEVDIDAEPTQTEESDSAFAFDSLESVRKKLLDLSGRNALLNYKHPKASCVRIIDELPDQIYQVLESGKTFTFIPVPEPTEKELIETGYMVEEQNGVRTLVKDYPTAEQWAKYLSLDTKYDLPAAEVAQDGESRHHDTKLQTLFYAPELESRLRSIRGRAETAIEESGSNILYLAMGFLQWYESRDSEVVRYSPLFTIPVRVEREKLDSSQGVYRYSLTMKDDGLLSNITLRELLAHNFGLVLPLVDEDSTPEAYFSLIVNTILRQQPRWKIRRQVSLALLNFSKQAMYQDLNPDNWPDNARIDDHPLIQMFFGGGATESEAGEVSYAEEYPIDSVDNAHEHFPLIYDADSSQHSALIDAVNGKSIVIEGPPGSGKSQTITNLIAASIASGQKVLFVAEKMAALNVVKNRLDKVGLGDFCLELHSHKTHKLKILQDLVERLNKQRQYRLPAGIDADVARYEDLKHKLSSYVEEINSTWKETGMTIHQILNKATRYREQYGIDPEDLKISGVDGQSFSTVRQKEILDSADMLANIYAQVASQAQGDVIAKHHWYGVHNSDLMGYQLEALGKTLESWNNSLAELSNEWGKKVEKLELNIDSDTKLDDIQNCIKQLGMLQDLQGGELVANIEEISAHEDDFKSMLNNYSEIHEQIAQISEIISLDMIHKKEAMLALGDSLNEFENLGLDLDSSLQIIAEDKDKSVRLNELVIKIKQFFEKINPSLPTELSVCFEITKGGLEEFVILINAINGLESDLWRHRDDLYDNSDIDSLLGKLTDTLRELTPMHQELMKVFSLHRLPQCADLKKYWSIIKDAGFFSIFSAEWRHARREVLALSSEAKPNKKLLFSLLPTLVNYVEGIEKIDNINNEDPLLDDLYKGVDTPLDRIIKLRSWYQSIRNEYGIGFGDRVSIGNALLHMDRNLAIGVQDAANHGLLSMVKDLLYEIDALSTRYSEFHPMKKSDSRLDDENNPLLELTRVLSKNINSLTRIVTQEKVTLKTVKKYYDRLVALQSTVESWNSNPMANKLVPEFLPLSIQPGEYSEQYLNSAKRTLDIIKVVSLSDALKNSLFADPVESRYDELIASHQVLSNLFKQQSSNAKLFLEEGEVNYSEWTELCGSAVKSLIVRNQSALSNPNWLNTWLDYVRLKKKLYADGLDNIISGLESEKIQTKDLNEIVQLVVYHQLAVEVLSENKSLAEFSGLEQMAIREKFQEYDRRLMQLQREKIAYKASREMPPMGNASGRVSSYTEISLIKHEAGKKTRHIAVRRLIDRAGESIQTLKPCFMMSPMSVAQYLKPGQFKFDLIVMDEASQIRPEDALGAIARGDRLVVVGDPKQLPPTSFFTKVLNDNDNPDAVALEESESILESVIPMFTTRRLRWHYRSRHESLIAFSNQNFYDSNLILFPSPFQETDEFGIRFTRVARGRFHMRRNVEEARELVNKLALQITKHPDESVGIVAMSSEQRDEIERQWDQKVKEDPILQLACEKMHVMDDPIFIKNLENVQGDERDVIIISMTYGPEQVGGRTMQRFGPINSNVGWRRLNVLFTRSKKRMHIFSSMGSGDVLVSERSSRGVKALRAFLEYCETGHLHHTQHTGRPADSDFEIAVMRALSEKGYECEPQLGVAGYFLDLAVRDPGQPGRFLMGVECDGATYHSAKSTRDRDRLRQDILENLGWRIRRIWSTDWFKNPQAQLQPILQELERLKTAVIEMDESVDDEFERITIDEMTQADFIDQEEVIEETVPSYVTFSGDYEVDLKTRLKEFDDDVIRKEMPDTDDGSRLLRPAMTEALLNHLPCSKAEFLECIPAYLRTGTDTDEGKQYLQQVLDLIADFG